MILYIKLNKLSCIRNYQNPRKFNKQTYPMVQTVTDNTKHRHDLPSYQLIIDKTSLHALIRIRY